MSSLVKKAWEKGKEVREFGIEVSPSTDTVKVLLKHPEHDKPLWTAGAEERELWKEGYEERLISELKGRDYEVAKRRIGGGYAFMRYVWVVSKGGRELLEIGPFETTTLGGIRGFSIGIWIVFPWRTYEIKLLERSDEALRALNDYFTTSIVTKLYLGSLTSRPIEYKILGETKRVDFPSLKEEEAGKILDKLIEA